MPAACTHKLGRVVENRGEARVICCLFWASRGAGDGSSWRKSRGSRVCPFGRCTPNWPPLRLQGPYETRKCPPNCHGSVKLEVMFGCDGKSRMVSFLSIDWELWLWIRVPVGAWQRCTPPRRDVAVPTDRGHPLWLTLQRAVTGRRSSRPLATAARHRYLASLPSTRPPRPVFAFIRASEFA